MTPNGETVHRLPPQPRYRPEHNRPDTAVYSLPDFVVVVPEIGTAGRCGAILSTFETTAVRDGDVTIELPRYHAIVRDGHETADLGALFAALANGDTVPRADADQMVGEFLPDILLRPLVILRGVRTGGKTC